MKLHVFLAVPLTLAGLTAASIGAAAATNIILDDDFANAAPKSQVIDGLSFDWTTNGAFERNNDPQQGEGFSLYEPANGNVGSLTPTVPASGEHVALEALPGGFTQAISGLAAWAQNRR